MHRGMGITFSYDSVDMYRWCVHKQKPLIFYRVWLLV